MLRTYSLKFKLSSRVTPSIFKEFPREITWPSKLKSNWSTRSRDNIMLWNLSGFAGYFYQSTWSKYLITRLYWFMKSSVFSNTASVVDEMMSLYPIGLKYIGLWRNTECAMNVKIHYITTKIHQLLLLVRVSLLLHILTPWWRHQMETFCVTVRWTTGHRWIPLRSVTRSFHVLFDLHLKKQLSKQSRHRWFKKPPRTLWRQCNVRFRSKNIPIRSNFA